MLLVSVCGADMAFLLGTGSRASVDSLRCAQAFGTAQGGLNWYMMRLAGISDWSAQTNQAGISLGPGTFDITINSRTASTINFTVTGKVSGTDGVTIQRVMTQSARKAPRGAGFAVFWGRDTGAFFQLRNSTVINGDLWSRGTTEVLNGNTINGTAYRPDTEDITGAGTYTEESVASPYPSMPAITATYYTGLIATYDAMIAGAGTVNQDTDLALAGTTITCQDFNTNTTPASNVTISGNGYIIASRDINLNTAGGSGRGLTVSPSGGNIVFIAARNININTGGGSNSVTINPNARFYCRCNGNNRLITVNNNNTNIDGVLMLGNRRIVIQNSANLTNSTLFVNYPGSDTNNYLQATDAGTSVGTTAGPCSLISVSPRDPGLIINNNASVAGLVYHHDAADTGYTQINTATITGSVISNQYTNDRITAATITYDLAAIPDPPPEGIDVSAVKGPDSWSGN